VPDLILWISLGLAPAAGLLLFFYLWKPHASVLTAVGKRVIWGLLLGVALVFIVFILFQGISTAREAAFSAKPSATGEIASYFLETPSSTPDLPAYTPSSPPSPSPSPAVELPPTPASSPPAAPYPTSTPSPAPDPLASPSYCIPEDAQRQPAELVEILDGDTIRVRLEDGLVYQVRYLGMDTPERGELYCAETTFINEELLASGPLTLLREVSEKDRYDRLLRHIFAGEVFVNFEMVRLGFAHTMLISPDIACAGVFLDAEAAARDSMSGLWGFPTATSTPLPTSTPVGAQDFTVLSLSSPVAAGSYASLSIQANPGSSCSLSYTTPAGTISQAKGLGGTAANSSGVCSWSWFIGSSTRPGTGSIKVTADGYTKNLSILITSP
jgi:endonuclease YncB( thermonuclease family)